MTTKLKTKSLAVGCAVFCLLLSGIATKGQNRTTISQLQEQIRSAPTLSYCELLDGRERYEGKVVRVRGIYSTGFEESLISSPQCDVSFLSAWVKFDSMFDRLTERKWRRKIEEVRWSIGVDVVFVGKFEGRGGFGHLDQYWLRLTVLSAENVQPLGKFRPLPEGAVNPSPADNDIVEQLPFCDALASAETLQSKTIQIKGILNLMKEESLFFDWPCSDKQGFFADFSPNWRATTDPRLAKLIDSLRPKTAITWSKLHYTAFTVNGRNVDFTAEGFIIPNPEFTDKVHGLTEELRFRTNHPFLFTVQRVIAAKETSVPQEQQYPRFGDSEFGGTYAGFAKSPLEGVIVELEPPFSVREIKGVLRSAGGEWPGTPAVVFEVRGPAPFKTVKGTRVERNGKFQIDNIPDGTYSFKATASGWQSVTGTIIVSKNAKQRQIEILMPLGQ